MNRVLVVGGTGPTGVPIVNNFLAAGFEVSIFHSGTHPAEFAGPVERIIGNARDEEDIRDKLGNTEWDVAVCTYGRLRSLAAVLAGRTRRLVGITGQPVYRGRSHRRRTVGFRCPFRSSRHGSATPATTPARSPPARTSSSNNTAKGTSRP